MATRGGRSTRGRGGAKNATRGGRSAGKQLYNFITSGEEAWSVQTPVYSDYEEIEILPAESEKEKVIKNALRMSDKLSFSDFSATRCAFRLSEECHGVNRAEKILIDNIWVAMTKQDTPHQIANLNGLALYFLKKSREQSAYIIYNGPQPGIYKRWASVVKIAGQKELKYRKVETLEEAYSEIRTTVGSKFYVEPEIKDQVLKIAQKKPGTSSEGENWATQKKYIELEKKIIKLKEEKLFLLQRCEQLEAELKYTQ